LELVIVFFVIKHTTHLENWFSHNYWSVLWGLVKEGSYSSNLPHVIDAATRINKAPSNQLSVDAVTP